VSDLIVEDGMCVGVQTIHRVSGVPQVEYATRGVVLATGGLSNIYQHSTNPTGFNALGSSVGLAVRAGVAVQDLEYVQFHPTVLYIPKEPRFLLTEALRGEGAVLRNAAGRAFALDFHPDGELAPRDIVARGVFEEGQKGPVYLDITHRNADWLHQRFPSIQAHLSQYGLDLAKDPLPVTPAAHYTCGGITTDLQGRTGLPGLYAAGEAARTGLHGGNRLASTSLLEGLVFGSAVADFVASPDGQDLYDAAKRQLETTTTTTTVRRNVPYRYTLEPFQIENAAHRAMKLLKKLRAVMWDHVGVVRTPSGLMTAAEVMSDIQAQAKELHRLCPTLETTAVRDAAYAGWAVTQAALANPESKGAHCIVPDIEEEEEEEHDEDAAVAGQ
jgi:L-aspartate oxidase